MRPVIIFGRTCSRMVVLCGLCLGVLAGIFLARRYPVVFSVWWLALLLPALIGLWRRSCLALCVLAAAGLLIGWQRGSAWQQRLDGYRQFYGQTVVVSGRIRDDPAYNDKRQLDFRLEQVSIDGWQLPGQVRVRALGADGATRGDWVEARGRLQTGFGNYQAALSFVRVRVARQNTSPIEQFRRMFFAEIYSVLPDPQASLGLGFLVGLRAQMPIATQEQMQILALTHIVVASGYNLTVLIRLSRRLLMRFSRFQAFAGSMLLMGIMMMLTGMSPSMSRAGLVASLSLVAWYFGRAVHPVLLLLLGAACTAWWNPLYPWSDLGWWLSFLAFAGVLLVAPLLHTWLHKDRAPPLLLQVATETLAAHIMVTPLVAVVFGQVSILGLVANVLVVPVIPIMMLTTLVGGLCSMWWAELSWAALPALGIGSYIVRVVESLASVSWAAMTVALPLLGLVSAYVCIGLGVLGLRKRLNYRFSRAPSMVE